MEEGTPGYSRDPGKFTSAKIEWKTDWFIQDHHALVFIGKMSQRATKDKNDKGTVIDLFDNFGR